MFAKMSRDMVDEVQTSLVDVIVTLGLFATSARLMAYGHELVQIISPKRSRQRAAVSQIGRSRNLHAEFLLWPAQLGLAEEQAGLLPYSRPFMCVGGWYYLLGHGSKTYCVPDMAVSLQTYLGDAEEVRLFGRAETFHFGQGSEGSRLGQDLHVQKQRAGRR